MRAARAIALGTTVAVAAAVLTIVTTTTGAGATSNGGIDPADFTNPRQNSYYPLKPGTVSRLRGTDDGERFHERVRVTHRTKRIEGVDATVVVDVLRRADGSIAEKTHDWYAADNDGNVWYLGEATATYDAAGHVKSRGGSWEAGVDGARAGLIMPADPHPTDAYRQEFRRGHAEDQAWIVQRRAQVTVPYGHLRDVVRSLEWSRLEKDVVSVKLYAPGLGIVKERDMAGGSEVFELVSVSRP
jgi:hypothetical protein